LEDGLRAATATRHASVWSEPYVHTRIPWLYNLSTDPYERADTDSNTHWDWYLDPIYLFMASQTLVQEFLATFKDFPSRQKAASFTIERILQRMSESVSKD
jgi:arylsulfatase